jgi:hypothetical protein
MASVRVSLVLAVLALVGCTEIGEPLRRAIRIDNRTGFELTFMMHIDGAWLELGAPIGANATGNILGTLGDVSHSRVLRPDGCTIGDVVAFQDDGVEVARHPPPLCLGETWAVTPAAGIPATTAP